MKDREQRLGLGSKSLRGLAVAGLLLSGCGGIPPEKQVKKIDLGGVEITQLSPHSYGVETKNFWADDNTKAKVRALAFLKARCNIELEGERVIVVSEPDCVTELR